LFGRWRVERRAPICGSLLRDFCVFGKKKFVIFVFGKDF
jgi:hypothetical protein